MSKDIRSFFTVLSTNKTQSKSTNNTTSSKKRPIAIESSDEDVIPESPAPEQKTNKNKKRRKVIKVLLSSDSEDDKKPTSTSLRKSKPEKKSEPLKPANLLEVFGSEPIKQSKVPDIPQEAKEDPVHAAKPKNRSRKTKKQKLNTEVGIHNDKDFEKTLLELDDDFLLENANELDESINQALLSEKTKTAKSARAETEKTAKFPVNGNETEDSSAKNEKTSPIKNVTESKDSPKKKSSTPSKTTTPSRKRQVEKEHYDGDPDQERYEKRRQSAILYQKYLNRSGPAHHGSKELPKGKPDCLQNLCFIRTGVLDSLENHEFESLIKEHGGIIVHGVSKKVNYVVAGEDPGPAKISKAKDYGIEIITEDELLDLIRVKSGLQPLCTKTDDSNESHKEKVELKKEAKKELPKKKEPESERKINGTDTAKQKRPSSKLNVKNELEGSKLFSSITNEPKPNGINHDSGQTQPDKNLPWTEKYKPTNIKSIIGQQGDKSNVKRLMAWLTNWHKNHSGKNKPKLVRPSPWAKDDNGSYFKAALLSGSPGIGKTTTANLVAKELGFDVVEFNASDTRNKRLLHEEVSQLLSNKSLAVFLKDGSAPTTKHVLLMDEVDGMAGNEDRGGIQELINLIKNSNVPIICMCNDRNHQKMRSLVNYCFDLRFSRPRIEQIKGAMMSICFKEGIGISGDALAEVINGAGMDIRQILTHLSMWSAGQKSLSTETASKEAKLSKKDTPLGPWEVCRKVFSAEEHKSMSILDRSRLFFYDYSLAPLFVQDTYLKVMPHAPKKEHLKRFAEAADAISMGDVVDKQIRSSNNWSLLDVEAMYASVLPGHYLSGHVNGQIDFPSWLGKNSKRNKFNRLLSELQAHMRTSISGSKSAVNQDYLPHLRNSIIRPLIQDGTGGVDKALEVMQAYNLLREDLDAILEMALWPNQKDPMNKVDSKVKAAFTRTYNKNGVKLPYTIQAGPVKKRGGASSQNDDLFDEEEEEYESSPEDEDITKDAMIKAKKPSSRATKKMTESSAASSKRGKADGASTSRAGAAKRSKK